MLHELKHKQNRVDGMDYGAVFDAGGKYHYSLWRAWFAYHPRVVFVLLNLSAADEQQNDPTIRRSIGFARERPFGSVELVNQVGLVFPASFSHQQGYVRLYY